MDFHNQDLKTVLQIQLHPLEFLTTGPTTTPPTKNPGRSGAQKLATAKHGQ
jgi:hypothetical protein